MLLSMLTIYMYTMCEVLYNSFVFFHGYLDMMVNEMTFEKYMRSTPSTSINFY